jgi:DNA-directed RNA polymerase specialized sigma24 family protein
MSTPRDSQLHPPSNAADTRRHERFGRMIAAIYPQLRRIAATKAPSMGGSPSSLAQETICRIISLPVPPKDEQAALAIGCRLMEWLRIDRFRSIVSRQQRERHASSSQQGEHSADSRVTAESRRLSDILIQLGEIHPRMAEALVLNAVCRLTHEQIAATLEVSVRTIRRDINYAKTWVAARLNPLPPPAAPQSNDAAGP